MSDIGHNSSAVAGDELRNFIERVERLEDEKSTLTLDIREVYAEAAARGFDKKAIRKIISIRKQDAEKRREEQAVLQLYAEALGMDVFA